MKRILVIASLFLAITLVATQTAFAARVYNFLPNKVHVTGMLGGLGIHQITLSPGERSDSLGWGSANIVRVDAVSQIEFRTTDKPLCQLNFGVHADMQGGNYMTIGHRGNEIVCTMCGSEHNAMTTNVERTNHNWQGNSRIGC
jgi:hypothetical protein